MGLEITQLTGQTQGGRDQFVILILQFQEHVLGFDRELESDGSIQSIVRLRLFILCTTSLDNSICKTYIDFIVRLKIDFKGSFACSSSTPMHRAIFLICD
jgi:hypothetical protein